MSDFNGGNGNSDSDGFEDIARRAGHGLGAITPNRPGAANVRKRVARRRATMLGSVAAGLVVAIVAVSANNDSDGQGPKISIATSPSSTPSTLVEDPTTTTEKVPETVDTTTSIVPTTAIPTTTTTIATTTTTVMARQITVDTPTAGMSVPSAGPMLVSGTALTFESTVNIKIYDDQHNLILETFTMSASPDAAPGPYSISIEFPAVVTAPSGTLEVFEYSAKDGAEIHKVIVPIVFTP